MAFIEKFERKFNVSVDEIIYLLPEIQRNVSEDDVYKIIQFQKNYYNVKGEYCLNHTISIALLNDEKYLLDGQHRMKAYKILRKEFPERVMNVSLDIFMVNSKENLELTYKYINTHRPNDITYLGIDTYKILQAFEALFFKNFKKYFKSSSKPNRPNLSMHSIKEYIVQEDVIKKCNIKNGEELFNKVLELNRFYHNQESYKFVEWGIKDCDKIIHKIKTYDNSLYLGMYSNNEWIDRIIDHFVYRKRFEEMKHISTNFRPKITKSLRNEVWKKTNGSDLNGKCYCCGYRIEYDNFECGHIVAVSLGGDTNINNLRAICSGCNSDMKTMNLEEYKKLLSGQIS